MKHNYKRNIIINSSSGTSSGGRDDYYLKMPHEFPTSLELEEQHEMSKHKGNRLPDKQEIQHAANKLQNLLPKQQQTPSTKNGYPSSMVVHRSLPQTSVGQPQTKPNQISAPLIHHQNQQQLEPAELNIEKQPYRTTPLILPHAKTIHDHGEVGNKFISTVREDNQPRPYRTSTLIMPTPRTIHEATAGGPIYQPYRGPQYYSDKGYIPVPVTDNGTQYLANTTQARKPITNTYNSPEKLYSNIALAEACEALQLKDGVQMDEGNVAQQYTPVAVTYNASTSNGTCSKILPKTSNINQSSSFKKVMYSVMRDSDF